MPIYFIRDSRDNVKIALTDNFFSTFSIFQEANYLPFSVLGVIPDNRINIQELFGKVYASTYQIRDNWFKVTPDLIRVINSYKPFFDEFEASHPYLKVLSVQDALDRFSDKIQSYKGFVYCFKTSRGLVKVGSTKQPKQRLRYHLKHFETYGNTRITQVFLSYPHTNYRENEKEIHRILADKSINSSEFFKISFDDVTRLISELYIEDDSENLKEDAQAGFDSFMRQINPKIMVFEADNRKFPLKIIDRNGEKWVTRKQLEAALGVSNLRQLHAILVKRGELKENIHFMKFREPTTQKPRGGNPNVIVYSYRGIIRVAMASEGRNAVKFRDWAENVPYEVMAAGSCGESDSIKELKQTD